MHYLHCLLTAPKIIQPTQLHRHHPQQYYSNSVTEETDKHSIVLHLAHHRIQQQLTASHVIHTINYTTCFTKTTSIIYYIFTKYQPILKVLP